MTEKTLDEQILELQNLKKQQEENELYQRLYAIFSPLSTEEILAKMKIMFDEIPMAKPGVKILLDNNKI